MDKDTVQFINVTKALDPNTSSKELDELYEINDSEVRKALALNPNTSRETLLKMYQRYTKEEYGFNLKISINLVLNKNFPIDHLAEAVKTLIGRMSYRTVEENIKEVNELLDKVLYELDRSNLPIKFITDAQVYDERVEYRKKKGGYGITRPILALKINRITQKAERLFKKYRTPIEGELGGVIPKENDGRILYSSKEAELAINPNTPIETLTELGLNNKDIYVKQLVASNPSITPELIDKMFEDIKSYSYEGTYAMYELLLNPNFPMKKYYKCLREAQIHILYRFNGVISYWKKCWKKLARELDNPNCPIELIEDIIEGSKITRMSSTDIFMYDKNPYKSIMNSITQKEDLN